MITVLFFLSSGLFLGWSLGANDAANVFGTAVGTKMVRFRTAALVCSVFVILGAVVAGHGAAHTLGRLGSVNALGGAFTAAFAAAVSVLAMTRLKLPVSTSQAIIGAIVGWNIFAGKPTDLSVLSKIVGTWVLCPILAGVFAMGLFTVSERLVRKSRVHLFMLDAWTRLGLLLAGAFGAFSLGANNIANVMGVFVPVTPFPDLTVNGYVLLSDVELLFLVGGLAIACGVYTYSRRVMETVGSDLFRLSPVTALIVVISSGLVLFIFASQGLEQALHSLGLPAFPLVPVSSSQAVVGAVLGIGMVKGIHNIRYIVLCRICLGWVVTPVAAGLVCWVLLFFMQNVFMQIVAK
ncbi:MAG: inorganic phosphate transporter [Acidobacteria bacterium]|nr:inorganic phosphate transporter [Acidobacteriota bacterium]